MPPINRDYIAFAKKISALISALFVCAAILAGSIAPALAAGNVTDRLNELSRPRLANYYINWELKAEDLPELARWDLVVLDMEHQVKHPEYIQKLRQLNPSIVILAYITSQEITDGTIYDFQRNTPLRYELLKGVAAEWYIKNPQGTIFSFWKNTYMLDMSADCPRVNGKIWTEYLADFVVNRIAASGLWDGVLYDNGWQNLDWFTAPRGGFDIDRDGKADAAMRIDVAWRKGHERLLSQTRTRVPAGFLVTENVGAGHSVYAPFLDLAIYEHFPGFGWTYTMREAAQQVARGKKPFAIVNSTSEKAGDADDWRAMRFGYTSALLIDAFFSFDHGMQHAERWWYDEYDADLGMPIGKAYSVSKSKNFVDDSVWRRDFSRGIVLTNPSNVAKTVKLGGTYQKLSGKQAPNINDGKIVSEVVLAPHDGIILMNAPSIPLNSVFVNGASARTATFAGSVGSSKAFFSDAAPSGAPSFVGNIMGDSASEGMKIDGAKLEIWSGGKLVFSDYPFNPDYAGEMALAVAKPYAGDPTVFAVAQKKGGQVVIYNTTGKRVATIYPLGVAYQGGFSLAFANVEGDGREELIIGTGKGVQGQILVCDQTFLNVTKRIYPFDPKDLSGISVAAFAAAKKDAPAFVALSQGSKPLAGIFSLEGKKLKEFAVSRTGSSKRLDIRAVPGKSPSIRIEEY